MLCAIIYFFFIFVCFYCIYDCLKPKDFPPGPMWLPLLGCFLKFRWLYSKHRYYHRTFQALSRTYGPILGLKLGKQKIVVISTYVLVKKALLQDEFNGRPDEFFFRIRSFGKRMGVVFSDGITWSERRKFTMRYLRAFSMRESMKKKLTTEVRDLVNYLQKMSQHGAVQMTTAFDFAVINSLWSMFAGHRFEYNDKKIQEIFAVIQEAFRLFDSTGGVISQMPFLRFVIPKLSGYNDLMRILNKLWDFLNEEIEMHEKMLSNNPRDLIDTFLLEIYNKDKHENTIFDRENLLILCLDLFMAGTKTTTDALANAFLGLSLYTKWLKILQAELDCVVGRSRSPTEDDLPFLPITQAYLAEVYRHLVLAPLGVPHRTQKDVSLNGYRIPKDTIVLFDFDSVHHDKTCWDQPNEFRPERFLDEQGQFCHNNFSMPFGLGKRRCLGEVLARSSVFLFFTNVVHYFDIEISSDHDKPDLSSYDGFTISPKPYYLKLSMRSTSDLKD